MLLLLCPDAIYTPADLCTGTMVRVYPYPGLNCCSKRVSSAAQVSIPDNTAAELLDGQPGGLLSMCAGDFVEVRRHACEHSVLSWLARSVSPPEL